MQPQVPREIQSHRHPELDALRGLAAITVVFHHLLLLWMNHHWYTVLLATPLRLFCSGPQAVILFFVLSGFVLSGPQSATQRPSYGRYLLKRFSRIYLPFLVALLFAFVLDQHLYLHAPTSNPWLNETWGYRATVSELLQAALTRMRYAQLFNTAFWSVFLEIQISLVFPLLFELVNRIPAWLSMAIAAVLLAVRLPPSDATSMLVLQTLACFLVGILAYRFRQPLQQWFRSRTLRLRMTILVVVLGVYTYGRATVHMPPVPAGAPVVNASHGASVAESEVPKPGRLHTLLSQIRLISSVSACVLLIVAAITLPSLQHALSHAFLLRLGALSYSIYLMHGTVLFAMQRSAAWLLPPAIFIAAFLVIVYLVAELFHLLVDAPAVRLGRLLGHPLAAERAQPLVGPGCCEQMERQLPFAETEDCPLRNASDK